MDRLELPKELYTGIEDIDAHHTELYNWADRIIRAPADERDLKAAIAFLASYVGYHFAAEEFAMRLHSFPDIERHRKQHKKFVKLVGRFHERAMAGGVDEEVREKLRKAFKVWFAEHIGVMDRKFGEFLKKKKVDLTGVLPLREALHGDAVMDEYDQVEYKRPFDGEITQEELRIRLKVGAG